MLVVYRTLYKAGYIIIFLIINYYIIYKIYIFLL